MAALTHAVFEQRVLDGLCDELALFGGASETSFVVRRPGLVASVSPATPERSIFNSIYPEDRDALAGSLEELEGIYRDAGVRAWIVWLRGGDPLGAELLEPRGYVFDGSPRSMALELAGLCEPARPLPEGVDLIGGDLREVGAINDAAYGYRDSWEALLRRPPPIPVRWAVATAAGEPVACAGVIDVGDDAQVTAVATRPEQRGKGLAGHVVHALLREAAERGARTGSLQASKAGSPVYARIGFEDVGHTDLWERRA